MIKAIIKYGFAGGVALVLYLYIMLWTGIMYSSSWVAWLATLAIVMIPIAVFLSLKELKVKVYGGRLPFIPAFFTGVLVAGLGAAVYGVLMFMDAHYFNLSISRPGIDGALAEMRASGASETQIAETEQKYLAHYNSFKPHLKTILHYLMYGAIYASVSWVILSFKYLKNKVYATEKFTRKDSSP